MAVDGRRVTVTTTATRLDTADTDSVSGKSIAVNPASAIDIGDDGVTAGAGFEVGAGVTFSADLGPGEALYGIAASGTVEVDVFETGI